MGPPIGYEISIEQIKDELRKEDLINLRSPLQEMKKIFSLLKQVLKRGRQMVSL